MIYKLYRSFLVLTFLIFIPFGAFAVNMTGLSLIQKFGMGRSITVCLCNQLCSA